MTSCEHTVSGTIVSPGTITGRTNGPYIEVKLDEPGGLFTFNGVVFAEPGELVVLV
jgi:hypothetical protein